MKNTIFRSQIINDRPCWLVRDLGKFLGYGSNGGNLSRMLNGAWKSEFTDGVNAHLVAGGKNGSWWLPHEGVLKLFDLIRTRQSKYAVKLPELARGLSFKETNGTSTLSMAEIVERIQRLERKVGIIKPPSKKTVAKKATPKPAPLPGVHYVGQRRPIKGKKFVVLESDLKEFQALSDETLRDRRPKDLTTGQVAVRELIIGNRNWARKNGKSRVHGHLKAAVKRGVATWRNK